MVWPPKVLGESTAKVTHGRVAASGKQVKSLDGLVTAISSGQLAKSDGTNLVAGGVAADIAHCVTGSYTGDGGIAKFISVSGFTTQIKYVRVWLQRTSATTAPTWETTDLMDDNSASGLAVDIAAGNTVLNAVWGLSDSGFFVDDASGDNHPNTHGLVYEYLCIGV